MSMRAPKAGRVVASGMFANGRTVEARPNAGTIDVHLRGINGRDGPYASGEAAHRTMLAYVDQSILPSEPKGGAFVGPTSAPPTPEEWRVVQVERYQAYSDEPVPYNYECPIVLVSSRKRVVAATITELGHVLECDDNAAHKWLLDEPNEVDEVILFGPREHPCDVCGVLTQATFIDPEDVAILGWLCRSCEPEIAEQKRS